MLIAEELFLLMRRDDGKPESMSAQRGYGLAAAVITDLVLAERITLSDDKDPRMSVLRPGPAGHPALDAAMSRLVEREGKKLSSLVTDRRLAVEAEVAAALAAAGVIGIEEKRALGLVPAKYPVRDPEPERRTREQLRVVLAGGTPRPEDATLLAILQGLGVAPKVLERGEGHARATRPQAADRGGLHRGQGRRGRRQGGGRDEHGDHDRRDHPGDRRRRQLGLTRPSCAGRGTRGEPPRRRGRRATGRRRSCRSGRRRRWSRAAPGRRRRTGRGRSGR